MQKLFILLLAIAFTSCKTIPDKVHGIPESAFWIGGEDGGDWYTLDSINKLDKTIHCKIYNDNSGELIADKTFKLHCYLTETKIDWNNLQEEFNGYDGEYLLLKTRDADNKSCYFK